MGELKLSNSTSLESLPAAIKVVFFTHYSSLYGANRSLLNLLDGLKKYSIVPHVISSKHGEIIQELDNRKISFRVIPSEWWISHKETSNNNNLFNLKHELYRQRKIFSKLRKSFAGLRLVKTQLEQWNADIIYTNSSVLPIGFIAAKSLGIPHVWHVREFVDLDYEFAFDLGSLLTKKIINSSHKKIAVSKAIQSHFHGEKSNDWRVIYNGVASESQFDDFFTVSKKPSNPSNLYTFAIIGKIHPCKGQETALEALSIVSKSRPNCQLLIVGEGDASHLKTLANHLNIEDKVRFWGHINNPFDAFMAADAILMCSKNEGMGRVTAEAMAACRPVIGFNNAGTSELIEHGKNGLLYSDGPQELALHMSQLISHPSRGFEMGLHGWKDAREKYSIENYARQVFEVISSIQKEHNFGGGLS